MVMSDLVGLMSLVTIFAFGLAWLCHETEFLHVRLPVGKIVQSEIRKSWDDLKNNLLSVPERYQPFWYKHPEAMQPLCGLDWLENTMHVIPEYKFEINAWGVRSKIALKAVENNETLIKEIAQATLKPTPAERKMLKKNPALIPSLAPIPVIKPQPVYTKVWAQLRTVASYANLTF